MRPETGRVDMLLVGSAAALQVAGLLALTTSVSSKSVHSGDGGLHSCEAAAQLRRPNGKETESWMGAKQA